MAPATTRVELARRAAATMSVDATAAEVSQAFARAGIPSLLLRGPAIAAWLYEPTEVRAYEDVDLLVPVESLAEAESVLRGLGFAYLLDGASPSEGVGHARTWTRRAGPAVDLHSTLYLLDGDRAAVWRALVQGARELEVAGATVAVPSDACLALIVALHALQHGPDDNRVVGELRRALRTADDSVWREAAELAARLGCGGSLRAALGLVDGGLGLADQLGLPAPSVRAAVLARSSADARKIALALDRIGASPSWREKARLVARGLVPSPGYLRGAQPYGPASLATSYRRRWAHLLSVLDGYRDWRSAVRACGGTRRLSDRAEVVAWSLATHALVTSVGPNRTIALLDRVPLRRDGGGDLASHDRDALFRLAGRCLGESIARSEYLRARGRHHDLVYGVSKRNAALAAHAWIDPLDSPPEGFEVLHRFSR